MDKRLFKVFLIFAPLLFMWLLVVYAAYPAAHSNYIIDFPAMLVRAQSAFTNTLYTWWNDVSSSITNDFDNAVGAWSNTFSNGFGNGGWWETVISYLKSFFVCLAFIFSAIGKILFYYPLTLLYNIVVFIGNIFSIIFVPSYYDVGSYYKEGWSVDWSEWKMSFDAKLIVDNINI